MQSWMLIHHKQVISCIRCTLSGRMQNNIIHHLVMFTTYQRFQHVHSPQSWPKRSGSNKSILNLSFLSWSARISTLSLYLDLHALIQLLHKFPSVRLIFLSNTQYELSCHTQHLISLRHHNVSIMWIYLIHNRHHNIERPYPIIGTQT